MLSTKNYGEVNNLFTELTSEESADVNGGGPVGTIVGSRIGGALGSLVGLSEAGALLGGAVGNEVGDWLSNAWHKLTS